MTNFKVLSRTLATLSVLMAMLTNSVATAATAATAATRGAERATSAADAASATSRIESIRARFADAGAGVIVVAHRGCHSPSPRQGLPSAPENSLAALDHCVKLGVDVMETDVRRAADGNLVILHDDTLERTTDGSGKVSEKTLADLRGLRLREDVGGATAPLTDQRIVTLDEMLAHARGRIVLNLDIKDPIYSEVIDAVIRAGAQREVILKTIAGIASPPLASVTPFDRVPFMPILINAKGKADLAAIAAGQLAGAKPVAIELPRMTSDQLPAVASVAGKHGVRLMINTIGEGFLAGVGGDADALRDPDRVWGKLSRAGVSIFQTDEPAALIIFLTDRKRKSS